MPLPHPTKAKYLYSPRNGIVCINTELKRKMCPWCIPCNKLDASDIMGEPEVTTVYREDYDSSRAEAEAAEAEAAILGQDDSASADDQMKTLRLQIMSSEKKAELGTIGADLGVEVNKRTTLKEIKAVLLERIDLIQEQS